MARHLLIATATSKYENLRPSDERPQLSGVLAAVVRLFTTTLGHYERELGTIAENPTANTLRVSLDEWFASPKRDPSDWVVFYYTGHAEVVGSDSLYLLTSDFRPNQYVGTAFSLQQLADLVLAKRDDQSGRRVRNLLVIIDTCFAGIGIDVLTSSLSNAFRKSSGSSFYLLGAALPRQEAQAGALARALIESIEELSTRHVMQEWLFLEQIVPAINRRLHIHAAIWSAVDSSIEEPHFFPNPSFVNTDGKPVLAVEAQRAISDQEYREHWGPRSRGVEFDNQAGSYFSGRAAVLDKLTSFLNSQTDNQMRVVTGRPGAGKSAVLSRLVNLALPDRRAKSVAGLKSAEVAVIDLALHAKGKSLGDVTARLAGILGVEAKTNEILEQLRRSTRPIRIIVDALDEAAQPVAIAEQLLRPLGAIDSVKLVVGTRANQLANLRGAEVIDIDEPEFAKKLDIAAYVRQRLLRADEPGQSSPYEGREQLAKQVGEMVANKAYPNFLIARLVVEDLLSRPRPVDPNVSSETTFPTRVSSAFNDYIARFGTKATLVRDILFPLAYAEGQGLPWDNIWASLASALSSRSYGDDDVRWVLENAGAFILEGTDNGRSVYRLYHQALADTLRVGKKTKRAQRIFTEILIGSIPPQIGPSGPNWLLANRYCLLHLATHAAKCELLADLMLDPLYLLTADASRLLSVLETYADQVPRQLIHVYKGTVHHLREKSIAESASYLESTARQSGLDELASEVAGLPFERAWSTPWARWNPRTTSRAIALGDNEITALIAADWDKSRPVALVGRRNGGVEVWDIHTGEQVSHWRPDGVYHTRHLSLVDKSDGRLLTAAWSSGHLGVKNLSTDKSIIKPIIIEDEGFITGLCTANREGTEVCITADGNLRLAIWELPTLELIYDHPMATRASVYFLGIFQSNSGTLLVSAGDSLQKLEKGSYHRQRDSMLRFWSLKDLSPTWEAPASESGVLEQADAGVFFGLNLVITSTNGWGTPSVWDIDRHRIVFQGKTVTSRTWIREIRRETLLFGEWLGQLTVQRLDKSGTKENSTLLAKTIYDDIQVHGERFSNMFDLHGRSTMISSVRDHVRVWDVEELLDERSTFSPSSRSEGVAIHALAVSAMKHEIYAGSASGKIIALNTVTGNLIWEKELSASSGPVTVAVGAGCMSNLLVAGCEGLIYVIDTNSPSSPPVSFKVGDSLIKINIVEYLGRQLAFASTKSHRCWAVRIWDLNTGKEVDSGREYNLIAGEEDKPIGSLVVTKVKQSVRFAFASKYGKVMVADLMDLDPATRVFPDFKEWYVAKSVGEYITALDAGQDKDARLLAAGTENGDLTVWNFTTGKIMWSYGGAHLGPINILSFRNIDERAILASGGADGVLRLWVAERKEPIAIQIGEPISALSWADRTNLAVGTVRGTLLIRFDEKTLARMLS